MDSSSSLQNTLITGLPVHDGHMVSGKFCLSSTSGCRKTVSSEQTSWPLSSINLEESLMSRSTREDDEVSSNSIFRIHKPQSQCLQNDDSINITSQVNERKKLGLSLVGGKYMEHPQRYYFNTKQCRDQSTINMSLSSRLDKQVKHHENVENTETQIYGNPTESSHTHKQARHSVIYFPTTRPPLPTSTIANNTKSIPPRRRPSFVCTPTRHRVRFTPSLQTLRDPMYYTKLAVAAAPVTWESIRSIRNDKRSLSCGVINPASIEEVLRELRAPTHSSSYRNKYKLLEECIRREKQPSFLSNYQATEKNKKRHMRFLSKEISEREAASEQQVNDFTMELSLVLKDAFYAPNAKWYHTDDYKSMMTHLERLKVRCEEILMSKDIIMSLKKTSRKAMYEKRVFLGRFLAAKIRERETTTSPLSFLMDVTGEIVL
eukprot:Tbor_TRINITY_DN3511_c0_g1::TRINITY_DN3511_c0_g1_i2::g.2855::m.2855